MRRSVVPIATAAGVAAVALCGVLIAVASCTGFGGVREEGIVSTAATASVKAYATPAMTPTPAPAVSAAEAATDPVKLVKKDPKVATDIREDLVACGDSADSYPVDTHFGDLTDSRTDDMIVNVSTCADGVGIGSYVYELKNGTYRNVFADEQPPVVAEISGGELKVTHQVYEPQDPVSNPSGEDITTYRWTGSGFTEISSTHRAYKATKDSNG
ncbi:hypothetical protein OG607_19075 [Streptomyces sp. NBC_01537]|uniref:hypothetical protein n=1 Tax=Streptomyces sp. NBC_01537 TaxID=2903896 RepID=UPI0038661ACE